MTNEQLHRLFLAAPLLITAFISGCKADISHLQYVEYGPSGMISDIEDTDK